MDRSRSICRFAGALALAACGLLASGCASCKLPASCPLASCKLPKCQLPSCIPRIDPTGERLFTHAPHQPHHQHPPHFKPEPDPFCPLKHYNTCVKLTPTRVIAPVGSEVVMTCGICGPDGYLHTGEKVEWQIAPGTVGQFLGMGQKAGFDWLLTSTKTQKLTNTYAVNTTSSQNINLNRGTPVCTDDVPVLKGQAWVTVSSPLEGVSQVTAFAPNVFAWDARQQTAKIYWIDAEWTLPPPAINPAGTRHTFTTTVLRHTNHCPVAGWRVRYEITGGPPAAFAPQATQAIEVETNSLGQARAELYQLNPAAGDNPVRIQVIRPATWPGGDGEQLVAGEGTIVKTWTSAQQASLTLRKTGPAQGSPGATLTYRTEVMNPTFQTIKDVIVTEPVIPGLTLVGSNPPGAVNGNELQWRLGDMQAGERRAIDVNYRADRAGTINSCATVAAAGGQTAQSCVATTIMTPTIQVAVTGPSEALVGTQATFTAVITNRGSAPATGLTIVDRFDPGLRHPVSPSPIERDLPELAPGQSQSITATFQVVAPGRQCNTIDIVGSGTVQASGQACLNAIPNAAAPGVPPAATPSQPAAPSATKPTLSAKKTGPSQKSVGDSAEFVMEITNTGTVAATNLKISDNYDLSLDPVSATDGHSFVGDDLVWVVDTLPPGKTIRFQVNCKCVARAAQSCNRLTVTSQEGSRADAMACLAIIGPSAPLSMTIGDLSDPIAVGKETTYEIRVTNPNPVADRNVTLVATLSAEIAPGTVGTSGPSTYTIKGQTVNFGPVAQLPAGATTTYRILARGVRPGTARLHVDLTSGNMASSLGGDATTTVLAGP